jgi:quercetin dioxygenase-like cupin family protein
VIVRWDDVQPGQDIGRAADALNVSLHRLELAPEETAKQSDAPVEEIVFVLEGSGLWENDLGSWKVAPAIARCDLRRTKGICCVRARTA